MYFEFLIKINKENNLDEWFNKRKGEDFILIDFKITKIKPSKT